MQGRSYIQLYNTMQNPHSYGMQGYSYTVQSRSYTEPQLYTLYNLYSHSYAMDGGSYTVQDCNFQIIVKPKFWHPCNICGLSLTGKFRLSQLSNYVIFWDTPTA